MVRWARSCRRVAHRCRLALTAARPRLPSAAAGWFDAAGRARASPVVARRRLREDAAPGRVRRRRSLIDVSRVAVMTRARSAVGATAACGSRSRGQLAPRASASGGPAARPRARRRCASRRVYLQPGRARRSAGAGAARHRRSSGSVKSAALVEVAGTAGRRSTSAAAAVARLAATALARDRRTLERAVGRRCRRRS